MRTDNEKLKNNLRSTEKDSLEEYLAKSERNRRAPDHDKTTSKFLLAAIIILLGIYFVKDISSTSINVFPAAVSSVFSNEPSEDLLNRMNAVMVEMGYTGLSHDDLRELRSEGVTATYISNVRALGFSDLTLEEAVRLANARVTSAFMAMMLELGYDLDIDDFIQLRRANVTAHYTSNIHDLGYTDVTTEQLIRMRRIGVTPSLIERLQRERGDDVPLEEIIRYRISNQ
jgi:hypothetical protein